MTSKNFNPEKDCSAYPSVKTTLKFIKEKYDDLAEDVKATKLIVQEIRLVLAEMKGKGKGAHSLWLILVGAIATLGTIFGIVGYFFK